MSKNIWIINEYAGNPYNGMEFRHYYLGKEFVKLGYKVTIISSSYSHLFKKLPKKNKENIDGIDYIWLKMFNYRNSHNKKRVLKWFLFMIKCFLLPLIIKNKPDTIIVSPMAPFPILPAWLISKFFKSKLIYEVKDIWPLSLIELGGFSSSHPFIKFMGWFERFALIKSDIIVSNLQNYGEHIKKLNIKKDFKWISNGIDLDELNQIEPLTNEIIQQIPKNKFIVGYTGTIGVANALDSFLESMKYVYDENIVYIIVGDGQEKKVLLKKYLNKNIIFIDAISKKQVQSILQFFDVCYIGLKKEELFKFGVSPNKLYDYMYSGKSILYAIESGKNIVDICNCGYSVESENPQAIAIGILKMYNLTQEERKIMGINGRNYVLEHFTYEKLAKKFEELL
ncbi:glycosyltransferase family 4 protein [Aliarcobacter cryaerophilus]|uniref:glycosyltransferase family 4 protein n=1 Tax=Aliarcobacter cryaerophilus TaxID=28198 RepID=UPI0021B195C6|nr:glycosyltransferase family 4 protein [Aliarcobacter cryaerophilus]MCT7506084.1 glycosyltransferase family 4 protein [Aliarcobacter cryaerophilus]